MSDANRGLFVSGTDTGVGKTFVSCALARALRRRGVDVGVMKPVETGVPEDGPEDARALRDAAGVDDALDTICPVQFPLPAAPLAAARDAGCGVPRAAIDAAFATLGSRHDFLLVEGAGGLFVPVDEHVDMIDLAERFALPVLLVARASLGTINHTRLSLEALERRGLECAGVVVSHAGGAISEADEQNLALLRASLGTRLVAELPPFDRSEFADHVDEPAIAVEALVRRIV